MHCSQTGSLPSDSCISPTGPIADRVNDFRLEAEGFDIFTNSSLSLSILLILNVKMSHFYHFIIIAIHRFDRLQDTGDVVQDITIPVISF